MDTNGLGQVASAAQTSAATKTENVSKANEIGAPKLSDKAQKYYEQLKKKYSNMQFILVSEDKKAEVQANPGKYASTKGTVVLIDTEKIEKMAVDESYRKKYEGILNNATVQMAQLKSSLGSNASRVKTFGMTFDDGGNAAFFAVIDKSYAAQRERIKENAKEKAEKEKKAEAKELKKKIQEKWAEKANSTNKSEGTQDSDYITVTSSSIEGLLDKINNAIYESMSDNMQTAIEKAIGQNVNYTA